MAANQQFLVCDSSTYANFFSWSSAFNVNLTAFGWAQSNDTGQVMWSGMNITGVSVSGTTATYTYTSLTGLPLAVGRALNVTGMTNAGNNKTVVITSFTGTTSGVFVCTNATAVNETGSSGVVTAQSTVPTSGNYVYEIWTPNDGLTPFYLRLEYGNGTSPTTRIWMANSTNGAGTLTGFITNQGPWALSASTSPSSTATWECDFSGAAGRLSVMMWRNSSNTANPFCFAVERSCNSSGTYTGTYVTLACALQTGSANVGNTGRQYSLYFGVGNAPCSFASNTATNAQAGLAVVIVAPNNNPTSSIGANSTSFNGSIPFSPVFPQVGYFDYPMTSLGVAFGADLSEGVPFQTTLYGATRTYMPSKTGIMANAANVCSNGSAVCMRYD